MDKLDLIFKVFENTTDEVVNENTTDEVVNENTTDAKQTDSFTNAKWKNITPKDVNRYKTYNLVTANNDALPHFLIIIPTINSTGETYYHTVHEAFIDNQIQGGYKILNEADLLKLFQINFFENDEEQVSLLDAGNLITEIAIVLTASKNTILDNLTLSDADLTLFFEDIISKFFEQYLG